MSTNRNKLAIAKSLATMTREQHVAEARRVSSMHRHQHIARLAISWITQFKKEGETVSSFHRKVNPTEALSTWLGWVRTFRDRGDLPSAAIKGAGSESLMRQAATQYRKEIKRGIERGVARPRSNAAVRVAAAINSGELTGFKRLSDVNSGLLWLTSSPRILAKWPLANLERLRNRLTSALECVDATIKQLESKARRA